MLNKFLLTILCSLLAGNIVASDFSTAIPDSSRKIFVKKNGHWSFELGKSDTSSNTKKEERKPSSHFYYGLTFSRVDLGFSKLVDNGSFTLSSQNDFLKYDGWKTSNFGFDLLQFGYRFNSTFKMYLSAGFDWTHIRLRRNITMRQDAPSLSYDTSTVNFSKNRFSSTYLRIPVSFELRTRDDNSGRNFKFVFGPDMGFLLNGKVKQVSKQEGKQKFNDDYNFTRFRYGAFARVAYGGAGLYCKYYLNDMFENSPNQEGLKSLTFGVTFGL